MWQMKFASIAISQERICSQLEMQSSEKTLMLGGFNSLGIAWATFLVTVGFLQAYVILHSNISHWQIHGNTLDLVLTNSHSIIDIVELNP